VITGFNTDIEHGGVVYHVQTEDKGLESPLILSLVYVGGAILASKRTTYEDLIAAGFDDRVLYERLERQHKLICAAIHAGRIEDLKRMGHQPIVPPSEAPTIRKRPAAVPAPKALKTPRNAQIPAPDIVSPPPATPPAAEPPEVSITEGPPLPGEELQLTLLDDRELRAGDFASLRIRVVRGSEQRAVGVPNVAVTVKILGTAFKPLVSAATTNRDGIAIVFAALPIFRTGRAAILIRVETDGEEAELRRIIHRA
jgi:hypothetical protein